MTRVGLLLYFWLILRLVLGQGKIRGSGVGSPGRGGLVRFLLASRSSQGGTHNKILMHKTYVYFR
jgi:hypothetical protein